MKKRTSSIKLLSLGLIGIILVTALVGGALALPTCVYALPPAILRARTIGELIITILAGANTAVTATPTVNGIYQACPYTYEDLVTDGVLTVEGLTTQEAIDHLGQGNQLGRPYNLDATAFRNLMYENWQTMIDNNIDTVFRIGDIANTDATYGAIDNIGQIALNVANNGYLALENTVAVISNPGAFVTVTLDNIKNAFINAFRPNIDNSIPIDTGWNFVGTGLAGYNMAGTIDSKDPWSTKLWALPEGTAILVLDTNTGLKSYGINITNEDKVIKLHDINSLRNTNTIDLDQDYNQSFTVEHNSYKTILSSISERPPHKIFGKNIMLFTDKTTLDNFARICLQNSTIPENPVRDIITEEGNITPSGADTLQPAIHGNEGLDIIPQNTYNDFVDTVINNNTENNYIGNGEELQDLINDNIYTAPQPTQPPVIPDQPTVDPKPSIAPEMQEQVLSGTSPNLTTKFPFCLPFDLVNSFKVLQAEAEAPYFEWNLQIERFNIDETIEVDLEPFTPVAEILRLLLLLGFIVGLILLTRQIIGA